MRIAVIGTGRMGGNLARPWSRCRHDVVLGYVVLGSRHPEEREEVLAPVPGARLASQAEALECADVVVLAVAYRAREACARAHADQLCDKLVIDISPPPYQDIQDLAGAEVTVRVTG